MEPEEQYREHVLRLVGDVTPKSFWEGLQRRARLLYRDKFSEVRANPQINDSQRMSVLWQDRHFAMEWLLKNEAQKNGVPASSETIRSNNCSFTLAGQGPVRFVQSYVSKPESMPRPSRFRRQLAKINEFERNPGLTLFDEERPLQSPSELTAILLSSPVGRAFDEDQQSLGAIGLHVPYSDFKSWAVSLTISEIISSYEPSVEQDDRVTPTIRRIPKTGEEG